MNLKPHCEEQFTSILHQEVIPLLQRERDFCGFIGLIHSDGTEALSVSIWDQQESANQTSLPVFKTQVALAKVLQGAPSIRVCSVSNSTLQTVAELVGEGEVVHESALRVYRVSEPSFRTVARTVNAGLKPPPHVASRRATA